MKKSLLLLIPICSMCFLSACGGASSAHLAATHLSVTPATSTPAAGMAFSFTVTALDASNSVVTSYAGTVHFTSSDGKAVLPGKPTLLNGTRTFSATLKSAGAETITATDTASASISGTSSSVIVVGNATHFSLTTPTSAAPGKIFNFTVTAVDVSNIEVVSYSGTVHFTSTDIHAVVGKDFFRCCTDSGLVPEARAARELRPVQCTVAPASPNASAMPRPTPRVAPATSTTQLRKSGC